MKSLSTHFSVPALRWLITAAVCSILVGVGIASRERWSPWLAARFSSGAPDGDHGAGGAPGKDDHDHGHGHSHDHGHGHDHSDHDHGHGEGDVIELSAQGLKNIGFRPMTVRLGAFEKTITVPAMIVERPGRSQIQVTAPLTGRITQIRPLEGTAVEPGSPLFDIRLTHEELVQAQREFLKVAEDLDVVNREIARLESLGEGLVAGKTVLEKKYERQKLEASLKADRQGLLLHALTEAQIDDILKTRKLLPLLTISAPLHTHGDEDHGNDHLFHVQKLLVQPGQQVEAGTVLCVLADHCELYIEGRAFEGDVELLCEASAKGWEIAGTLLNGERKSNSIPGLKLLYLADHVDAESRAFRFYLSLSNDIITDRKTTEGLRFIQWRYKPGQRLELRVPVERWEDRIVVPVDAVVDEGAENYVYRQDGDHFHRVPVHVEFRDAGSAVIANDGAVFPGAVIAAKGAYQMHLALKNQAGGGVDPHAGHNH